MTNDTENDYLKNGVYNEIQKLNSEAKSYMLLWIMLIRGLIIKPF